jgi:hypothetical protein
MWRKLFMDKLIDEIAHSILGTCKSLNEVCEEHGITEDDLTLDQLYELDDITMECHVCGWWCDTSLFNDEHYQICDDCNEDKENDDEK